jgi:cytochrome c biogenesis protein CcdA
VLGLIALALTIGLADSVNPSTIGPALYLATGVDAIRRIAAFTLGVFAVYLVGGIVLVLGPGQAILAFLPRPGPRATQVLELCLAVVLGFVAVGLWIAREHVGRRLAQDRAKVPRSSFAVGAAIMAVELPSAFPYFAVIAAVVGSGRSIPSQLALLAIFNVAFIAPLLAIAATRRFAPERGRQALERLRVGFDRHAAVLIPVLVLVIAVVLALIGTLGLVRR